MSKDNKNDDAKLVTPNSTPPAPGETQVVDNSAPADDNIKTIKDGDRSNTVQPGDPSVRTNDGEMITERDATADDLAKVSGEPETVTKPSDDLTADARGGANGQTTEEAEAPKSVTVVNPGGVEVEVVESDIVKRHLFAAGFTLKKGESYSAETKDEQKAHAARLKANGIFADADQGDPLQSNHPADVARRQGSKGDAPDADVTGPRVDERDLDAKPVSYDGVDGRSDGQVFDPNTNKPKKNTRLASALGE